MLHILKLNNTRRLFYGKHGGLVMFGDKQG